ncbi:MAG: hypothetical protein H7281_06495 [Bacteriovorax sp.]|nr:hypothetical protein [Bacteriovorax sp.]
MKVSTIILFLTLLNQQAFATDPAPASNSPKTVSQTYPTHTFEDTYYYMRQDCTVDGCVWGKHKSPEAQFMEDMEAKAIVTAGISEQHEKTVNKLVNPVNGPSTCGPIGANYDANAESDELVAAIFAGSLSKDFCSPAGYVVPNSLSKWWAALKIYSSGEKVRHNSFDVSIEAIKKQVDLIINDKSGSKNLQVEANQLQITLTNLTIQNVTERMRLRSELLKAGNEAIKSNTKENTDVYLAYKDILIADGLEKSLSIANDACKRMKKWRVCEDDAAPSTCSIKNVADPVQGCKEAQSQIPLIISGKVHQYGETYLSMSGPSKDLNEKLGKFEDEIGSLIKAVPVSADSKYDWSTPMNNGLKEMSKSRKNVGVLCKNDKESLKKITEATSKFEEATASMSGEKLVSTFALADMLVGQPYKRADYLQYFTDHISYIGCFDEAGRTLAQSNMDKLVKYGNSLASLGGSTSGNPGAGNAKATPSATEVNNSKTSAGSVGASASNQDILSNKFVIGGSTTNGIPTVTASTVSAKASGSSAGTGTLVKASSTSGNSPFGMVGSKSGVQNAIAAKSKEDNAKVNSNFSTLINSNGPNKSNNMLKVKSITTSSGIELLNKAFEKSSVPPSSNVFQNNAIPEGSKEGATASVNDLSGVGVNSNNSHFHSSDYSNAEAGAKVSNGKRSSSTSLGYSSPTTSSSTGQDKSSRPGNSGHYSKSSISKESLENSRILAQSITAKNTKSRELYLPKEDDSLFEVVTKAYIRNFEKVATDKAE